MSRFSYKIITKQRLNRSGLPPGTLSPKDDAGRQAIEISLIQFSETHWLEEKITPGQDLKKLLNNPGVTWINIDGVHDPDIVDYIGKQFDIHPLTLEDIMNTDQRPKFEDYDTYDVMMMKMLYFDGKLKSEQLSIILFDRVVLTFQEIKGKDAFDPVRQRIRSGKGKIRKQGADYLAYSLLDSVIDSYFHILDLIGSSIDDVDEELRLSTSQETFQRLYMLKREMIFLRKAVGPTREMISNIERGESPRITEHTYVYLRDVLDHSIRVMESADVFRDIVGGMMDIYHSTVSNKMNEVMKVLTSISTIFIPVTFIAGVYGMNFEYMPELAREWAYPAVMVLMGTIILTLFIYFRRKRWI